MPIYNYNNIYNMMACTEYTHFTGMYIASTIIGGSMLILTIMVSLILVYLKVKKIKVPKTAPLYEEISENHLVQHSNDDKLHLSSASTLHVHNIRESTIKLVSNECYGNSLKV